MSVLQLKLQLVLKDNRIKQDEEIRLNLTKDVEREQHESSEYRNRLETLKNSIGSLQQDVRHLQDANNEQKVSLKQIIDFSFDTAVYKYYVFNNKMFLEKFYRNIEIIDVHILMHRCLSDNI